MCQHANLVDLLGVVELEIIAQNVDTRVLEHEQSNEWSLGAGNGQ